MMNQLPAEIITTIVAFIPYCDLKSVWCVNGTYNSFKNEIIKYIAESVCDLEDLRLSIAECVKSLNYKVLSILLRKCKSLEFSLGDEFKTFGSHMLFQLLYSINQQNVYMNDKDTARKYLQMACFLVENCTIDCFELLDWCELVHDTKGCEQTEYDERFFEPFYKTALLRLLQQPKKLEDICLCLSRLSNLSDGVTRNIIEYASNSDINVLYEKNKFWDRKYVYYIFECKNQNLRSWIKQTVDQHTYNKCIRKHWLNDYHADEIELAINVLKESTTLHSCEELLLLLSETNRLKEAVDIVLEKRLNISEWVKDSFTISYSEPFLFFKKNNMDIVNSSINSNFNVSNVRNIEALRYVLDKHKHCTYRTAGRILNVKNKHLLKYYLTGLIKEIGISEFLEHFLSWCCETAIYLLLEIKDDVGFHEITITPGHKPSSDNLRNILILQNNGIKINTPKNKTEILHKYTIIDNPEVFDLWRCDDVLDIKFDDIFLQVLTFDMGEVCYTINYNYLPTFQKLLCLFRQSRISIGGYLDKNVVKLITFFRRDNKIIQYQNLVIDLIHLIKHLNNNVVPESFIQEIILSNNLELFEQFTKQDLQSACETLKIKRCTFSPTANHLF
jgi:hypothetical protein